MSEKKTETAVVVAAVPAAFSSNEEIIRAMFDREMEERKKLESTLENIAANAREMLKMAEADLAHAREQTHRIAGLKKTIFKALYKMSRSTQEDVLNKRVEAAIRSVDP